MDHLLTELLFILYFGLNCIAAIGISAIDIFYLVKYYNPSDIPANWIIINIIVDNLYSIFILISLYKSEAMTEFYVVCYKLLGHTLLADRILGYVIAFSTGFLDSPFKILVLIHSILPFAIYAICILLFAIFVCMPSIISNKIVDYMRASGYFRQETVTPPNENNQGDVMTSVISVSVGNSQVIISDTFVMSNTPNEVVNKIMCVLNINEYNSKTISTTDLNTTCSVCYDDFIDQCEIIELPCKHVYHQSCIVKWLEIKLLCPLCRHNPTEPHVQKEAEEAKENKEIKAIQLDLDENQNLVEILIE